MKKLISIIFLIIFLFVSSSFAFASSSDTDFLVSDPTLQDLVDDTLDYLDHSSVSEDDFYLTNISVNNFRLSSSDTSGLHSIILSLLGDYNSVVTDYEYRNNNNTYTSHSIDISPDWSWIATAVIFLVVLYSTFRLIGSIFSGRL